MPAQTNPILSPPRAKQVKTFVMALISASEEVLRHPNDTNLVLAFAEQLPTASWTIFQLAAQGQVR
jgi:hypothetical protein